MIESGLFSLVGYEPAAPFELSAAQGRSRAPVRPVHLIGGHEQSFVKPDVFVIRRNEEA